MKSGKYVKTVAAVAMMSLMVGIYPQAGEWHQTEQKWQYVQADGQTQKNSWLQDKDGKWYHFDEQGMMRTGWYQDSKQQWYYLDGDGSMALGWRLVNGQWYYLQNPSGALLSNARTPDGYWVDGNGAWNGKASINNSDDSSSTSSRSGSSSGNGTSGGSGSGTGNNGTDNNGTDNNGTDNNGTGNGGSDSGNTGGTQENPWASTAAINMEQTGIVSILGLPYAVISFTTAGTGQSEFTYSLAGSDVTAAVTSVTNTGHIVKVPLPDHNSHTLLIKDGEWIVSTILLKDLGESAAAEAEIVENGFAVPSDLPSFVLTKETIPLTQYLKFIHLGDSIYVKPSKTTVNSVQAVQAVSLDAYSSATTTPPVSLEGQEEEANIVVLFDMIVNHKIATALDAGGTSTNAFLLKWDMLEKTMVLNEDLSLAANYTTLANRNWQSAEDLPRYVKYLTEQANYGTKVEFLTGQTDSTNPPQMVIAQTRKGTDTVIQLSEENETWYRSITEIKIPYSSSNTFFYQNNNTLSADGRTLTLGVDALSGPMNYSGTYDVTIHAYEFADTSGVLHVVDQAPGFTPTWDDSNTKLKLRADFTYYTDRIESVIVNGQTVANTQWTTDLNNLYIPYRYLVTGTNTFSVQAQGYETTVFEITAPDTFITPKHSPELAIAEVLEGTASPIAITAGLWPAESEEGQWVEQLEQAHVVLADRYGTTIPAVLAKSGQVLTVTAATASLSVYNDYSVRIHVPGYDVVTVAFTPVKAPPVLTEQWLTNPDRLVLSSSAASYLSTSVTKVVINGRELAKGEAADYIASYAAGIELYAHNFTAGDPYRIELYAASYAVKVIEGTAPAALATPLTAPDLTAEAVLQGEELIVLPDSNATAWLAQVSSVAKISGSTTTACSFSQTAQGLVISGSNFSSPGTYSLLIKASGYRNAQITVKILNTVVLSQITNYDEQRIEITAGDSYFYSNLAVTLNGIPLTPTSDYEFSGYRTMYIRAELFDQVENSLILENPDYASVELTLEQYTAPKPAPQLSVEEALHGESSLWIHIDEAEDEWWELLEQAHITVKRSTTNQTITGIDRSADLLQIDLSSTLAYSYTYTVTIAVPGYRTSTVTINPYQQTPELDVEWLENGDLKLSTETYGYFSNSYTAVYVDGEQLENNTDYSLNTYYPLPYSLTILAEKFTAGEHTIVLQYLGSAHYLPFEITVTVPAEGFDIMMPEEVQNTLVTIQAENGTDHLLTEEIEETEETEETEEIEEIEEIEETEETEEIEVLEEEIDHPTEEEEVSSFDPIAEAPEDVSEPEQQVAADIEAEAITAEIDSL